MKKTLLIIGLLLTSYFSYSQLITKYQLYPSIGTFTELTDGTTMALTGGTVTAGYFNNIPIGFTFYYLCNPYTFLSAATSGYVVLGQNFATVTNNNDLDNATSTNPRPILAPLWDNLDLQYSTNLSYKTSGTAPNRTFTLQWINLQWNVSATGNTISMQLILYEADGTIEYSYRPEGGTVNTGSASIGISGGAGASVTGAVPILSLNNTSNSAIAQSTETTTLSALPDTGQSFKFELPYTSSSNPPIDINFTAVSRTTITVSFKDNSDSESIFTISRSQDINFVNDVVNEVIQSTTTATTGTTYSKTFTGLVPGATYYFRISSANEGFPPSGYLTGNQTTTVPVTISSAQDGNWNSTSTWAGGIIPVDSNKVVIKDGHDIIVNLNATCLELTVGEGTSGSLAFDATSRTLTVLKKITVSAGASLSAGINNVTHNLYIGGTSATAPYAGDLLINGTFQMYTSSSSKIAVTFFGNLNGTITGSTGTCNFNAITVNKGTSINSIVEAQRVITMQSPSTNSNNLIITSGTFKLSSDSYIKPYYGSGTVTQINGRLWINHASARIECVNVGANNGPGDITLLGTLQIDHGSFGIGSGNNRFIVYGKITLSGSDAQLTSYGNIEFIYNPSYLYELNFTAGNIIIDPQAYNQLAGTRDAVNFASEFKVNFTGGTLTIVDPNLSSTSSLVNELEIAGTIGTKNFAGSTIRFGNGVMSPSPAEGNATNGGFSISVPASVTLGNIVVNNPSGSYRNVRISNGVSGTCTMNNLTVTAGNFNLNGNTLNLQGSLTNSGSVNASATGSTLVLQGTSSQDINGSFTSNQIANLTIDNAAGVTMSNSPISISETLLINSGKKLEIGINTQLTVSGTLTNNGENSGLVIKSNASGTGSLIHSTSNVAATAERYIPAASWTTANDGWHLLSSPVAGQSISTEFVHSYALGTEDFYKWDEPTNYWINIKNSDGTAWTNGFETEFVVGRGYLVAYNSNVTKEFTGNLNVSNIGLSNLSFTGGDNKGYHLLGNPFSSSLKWNDGNWALSNVGGNAKIWHSANKSYSDIAANEYIPAMQGFMVITESATNSLTIPAASRTHNTQAYYKSSDNQVILLTAREANGNSAQESKVYLNPESTPEFDFDFDAGFLPGYAPQFYSLINNQQVSTNSIPEISSGLVILFDFIKNESDAFTIELNKDRLYENILVYLTDKKTGITQNITQNPVYAFTSESGDDPNRFELKFGMVGIEDPTNTSSINAYFFDGRLYVNTLENDCRVNIFNANGQKLDGFKLTGEGLQSHALLLPAGIYMAQIMAGNTIQTVKFVVQ